MRMAHIVSEMSTFSTNCTLCHDSTSLSLLNLCYPTGSNNSILSEMSPKCKKKFDFFQNNKNKVSFLLETGYNVHKSNEANVHAGAAGDVFRHTPNEINFWRLQNEGTNGHRIGKRSY